MKQKNAFIGSLIQENVAYRPYISPIGLNFMEG